MKQLHIDFQGLIAFIPNQPFAKAPTRMRVMLRDLHDPRIIQDAQGKSWAVGAHDPWIEFPDPYTPYKISGVSQVTAGTKTINVLLLGGGKTVHIQLDGKPLAEQPIALDPQVLELLPVYDGQLKNEFETTADQVAANFTIAGGTLSVGKKSKYSYEIRRHDGTSADVTPVSTLRWTIPFQKEVVLRIGQGLQTPKLTFAPSGSSLLLAVRNRELSQLLASGPQVEGGEPDPDYLVYGDSLKAGAPQVLKPGKKNPPHIVDGRRVCGIGGLQLK